MHEIIRDKQFDEQERERNLTTENMDKPVGQVDNKKAYKFIYLGLLFFIAGIILFIPMGNSAWNFLKGGLVWFVIGIGCIFILLALSEIWRKDW